MSVFRARAARRGISIPASKLAKWKTFTQGLGDRLLRDTGDGPSPVDRRHGDLDRRRADALYRMAVLRRR